ncbi:MAG: MBL fold metallo-hydrolase [Bacteroidetes bacterium]|nr:MBL fold metallo-hydrolase [Bacteroidota bacterium]
MLCIPAILHAAGDSTRTQVIILGAGNPNPDPENAGPAVAIVVGGRAYLVDAGAGVVRRAAAMSPRYGGSVEALAARNLTRVFLTHLHSDHTVGMPDLMLTPWVMDRDEPLQVYGPEGTARMVSHLLEAYTADIHYRLYGSEPANDQGWRTEAHEIDEGLVYRDSLVTVEAFRVPHGTWPVSFAYRFTTADRIVVISGDARPCEKMADIAQGADVLVHEVYYAKGLEDRRRADWKDYHQAHHTSTIELGRLAAKARPKLLVLYHVLYWGASGRDLLDEISTIYNGKVEVGRDLGIY